MPKISDLKEALKYGTETASEPPSSARKRIADAMQLAATVETRRKKENEGRIAANKYAESLGIKAPNKVDETSGGKRKTKRSRKSKSLRKRENKRTKRNTKK